MLYHDDNPPGEPQVVPGVIGVIYSDLEEVVSRLQTANAGDDTTLEGTKFSWKNESGDVVDVTCPHGEHSLPFYSLLAIRLLRLNVGVRSRRVFLH